jgi:hypothetical protein
MLFSYGTMQLESVQRELFGRALEGRPDQLPGYKVQMLEIRDPAVTAISGKRHHPIVVHTGEPADKVGGTLMQVTARDLERSDAYEVADYRRVRLQLASGAQAWVYVDAERSKIAG